MTPNSPGKTGPGTNEEIGVEISERDLRGKDRGCGVGNTYMKSKHL